MPTLQVWGIPLRYRLIHSHPTGKSLASLATGVTHTHTHTPLPEGRGSFIHYKVAWWVRLEHSRLEVGSELATPKSQLEASRVSLASALVGAHAAHV